MSHIEHIRKIKLFIKVSIIAVITILLIVLGFFVNHTSNFENATMKKWPGLSEQQKIDTLHRIIGNIENQELLIACVNKIAQLEEAEKMNIKSATTLCYNGIKLNSTETNDDKK